MRKYFSRVLALLLVMILCTFTGIDYSYGWGGIGRTINVTMYWHGSEPTPIDIIIGEADDLDIYEINQTITGVLPNHYEGNGVWRYYREITYNPAHPDRMPFVAVSRTTVDGKWYVDKWDWNNWIYQPGQYATTDNGIQFYADFYLTSSAPTSNSITINRSWSPDSAPVDSTFSIYRQYTFNGPNDKVVKQVSMSKDQNSITVSTLYGGNYHVVQDLPTDYHDDASIHFYDKFAVHTDLVSNTSAVVSFVNRHEAPHTISVPALDGGTIVPSSTQATQGTSVSLTVTPDANRQLKAGSLKYNDGSTDHPITGNSFIMPDSDVTVSAEFVPRQYSVGIASLSGGSITADPSTAVSGDTINLTITPDNGKQLKPGTLKYNDGATDAAVVGTSFVMPAANVTVSAEFELPVTVATAALPSGMMGTPYSEELKAQNGTAPYSWSISGMPAGLVIDPVTGIISGTPTDNGNYPVVMTVKDSNDYSDSKTITLTVYETFSIDLKSIVVSEGGISPAFDRNIVAYHVDTAADLDSVEIIAVAEDPAAALTINGEAAQSAIAHVVRIEQGENLIPIIITSPDGNSQKSYVVSVNGTVSNADLTSLAIDGQALAPTFEKDETHYTVNVGNNVNALDLTGRTDDPKALMLINGSIMAGGGTMTMALTEGDNVLEIMVVAQNAATKTYTITVSREAALALTTNKLPLGIVGLPYNVVLSATGGAAPYTWGASGLPEGLDINSQTGTLSGMPANQGQIPIDITVTDANGKTETKPLTLKLNLGCGNGGYLITPESSSVYAADLSADGIQMMTVGKGISGFKYFTVAIEPVTGHDGQETVVFVHVRNGQQIGINAARGDFDANSTAQAAFNVRPGDIIKVFIADKLTNDTAEAPAIL